MRFFLSHPHIWDFSIGKPSYLRRGFLFVSWLVFFSIGRSKNIYLKILSCTEEVLIAKMRFFLSHPHIWDFSIGKPSYLRRGFLFVSWLVFALLNIDSSQYRSSRPKMFCKKGVLRNFAKFTGKHLCQRLFFNKVAGLPESLFK